MKTIEDNLLSIFKCMTSNKKDWVRVTDEQKEKYFFIVNRNFSKKYPKNAQLFNSKNIDKVSCMNLWFHFMLDKPYPKWFWSKGNDNKDKPKLSKKDFNLLLKTLKIKDIDLDYLVINHFDFIKEELKYLNNLEKANK